MVRKHRISGALRSLVATSSRPLQGGGLSRVVGRLLCRGHERRSGMAFRADQYRKLDNSLDYPSRSGDIIWIALMISALASPAVLFW
jgi:hypothetical protein